jgi:TolB-like protein
VSIFNELKRRNVIRVGVAYLVASWLLIEASSLVLDIYHAPDWVSQVIVALLAIGFPVALFFAWAFELTPEGVKREHEVDRTQSVTHETAKRLDLVTIAMVLLAAGLLLADRFVLDGDRGAAAPTERSDVGAALPRTAELQTPLALGVAVLPFSNLSTDAENAFFASGVHEDVLTYLSRVADLRVISRTSVENYVDSELSLPAIGRELGVSHVVEGSVRRAGDRVRVTVQLIDAATDDHIWSENYDRTLTDIFAIQSEIAQQIVARVESELTSDQAAQLTEGGTTNIEAYDLLIEGRALMDEAMAGYSAPLYKQAAERFEAAVALDPDYLLGHKLLVEACGNVIWFGTGVEDAACQGTIVRALNRMRELAPDSPDTRTAIGIYRYRVPRDLAGAVEILGPVVAERPNDITALSYLAFAGRRLQLWDTAIDAIRRTVILDPANPRQHKALIELLGNRADYGAMVEAAAAAERRFPGDMLFRHAHAKARMDHLGETEGLREVTFAMSPTERFDLSGNPNLVGVTDSLDEAVAWVEGMDGSHRGALGAWVKPWVLGWTYYAWGEDEQAREAFQRALSVYPLDEEERLEVPQLMGVYAQNLALVGDLAAAREARELALFTVDGDDDVLRRNQTRREAADALAAMGEADAAWRELEPLIGVPGGFSRWRVYLNRTYRRLYADSAGYQAFVAEMESRQ